MVEPPKRIDVTPLHILSTGSYKGKLFPIKGGLVGAREHGDFDSCQLQTVNKANDMCGQRSSTLSGQKE